MASSSAAACPLPRPSTPTSTARDPPLTPLALRLWKTLLQAHGLDDTTYVYDLGNTIRLFRAWRAAMPRVAPFYAVKCNPEPALLRLLAALGAGFDCASKAELEAVSALGVSQDRVIFAHPCKRPADLRYASSAGVQLTTFDTEGELGKVRAARARLGRRGGADAWAVGLPVCGAWRVRPPLLER